MLTPQLDKTAPQATATLDRLASRAGQLYSLPAVAMEVLQLTADPAVHAHALKECIERDPALTSKLLRVVNSSLFGLSRHVSDLNQALALLGTKPLKLLVLGFSLPANLFQGIQADVLGWYWRRTLTKAVAARAICESWHGQAGDEAFIAALLQDLGVLLLIQELGQPYREFLHRVLALKRQLGPAEREAMGFDHTELTSRLLDRWRLPVPLIQAVAGEATAPPALAQTLQLAELAARFLADGCPEAFGQLAAANRLDGQVGEQAAAELLAALEEKVQQLADVLRLELPAGRNCQELLREAHRRLATVAETVAADLIDLPSSAGAIQPESQQLRRACRQLLAAAEPARKTQPAGPGSQPVSVTTSATVLANPVGESKAPPIPDARRTGPPELPPCPTSPGDLAAALAHAVASCRQARSPLSLLLVQLECDPCPTGPHAFTRACLRLEMACRQLDHPRLLCEPFGEAGFALILPDCDRLQAVQLGHTLLAQVRPRVDAPPVDQPPMPVSLGVATVSLPPRNFPAEELLHAAERCLYGSRASGGDVVKSIEI